MVGELVPWKRAWLQKSRSAAPGSQGATPGNPTRVSQRVGVGATEDIGNI